MAVSPTQDRRLLDRGLRKGELQKDTVDEAVMKTRDYAEDLRPADDEELSRLREDLASEKTLRDERIVHTLENPAAAAPPITADAPLDDEL